VRFQQALIKVLLPAPWGQSSPMVPGRAPAHSHRPCPQTAVGFDPVARLNDESTPVPAGERAAKYGIGGFNEKRE